MGMNLRTYEGQIEALEALADRWDALNVSLEELTDEKVFKAVAAAVNNECKVKLEIIREAREVLSAWAKASGQVADPTGPVPVGDPFAHGGSLAAFTTPSPIPSH